MHTSLPESKEVSVSVIVPVYNVYEWLDTCLDSIINQTFTDFEVLLINDGSTDGSFDKCHEWGKIDNRIKVRKNVSLLFWKYGIKIYFGRTYEVWLYSNLEMYD